MGDERDTGDDSTRLAGVVGNDETRFTGVGADRPPAPAAARSDGSIPPGSLLGHTYRIDALLARGGMGEVYRARHAELETEHAIMAARGHSSASVNCGIEVDVIAGHASSNDQPPW